MPYISRIESTMSNDGGEPYEIGGAAAVKFDSTSMSNDDAKPPPALPPLQHIQQESSAPIDNIASNVASNRGSSRMEVLLESLPPLLETLLPSTGNEEGGNIKKGRKKKGSRKKEKSNKSGSSRTPPSPLDRQKFTAAEKRRVDDEKKVIAAHSNLLEMKINKVDRRESELDTAQRAYDRAVATSHEHSEEDADSLLLGPSKWNARYHQLKAHFDREGSSHLKKIISDEEVEGLTEAETLEIRALSRWTTRQRKFKRNGDLEYFKVVLLARLKFEWAPKAGHGPDKWLRQYNLLKDFREEHGHIEVPFEHGENKLALWVKTQLTLYRNGKEGKLPVLNAERICMLEGLGIEWGVRKKGTPWEDRFQTLLEYKKCFGHVNVPWQWKENKRLAQWVNSQRKKYKDLCDGKKSNLMEDQINLLNSLGFQWNTGGKGRYYNEGEEPSKTKKEKRKQSPKKKSQDQSSKKSRNSEAADPLAQLKAQLAASGGHALSVTPLTSNLTHMMVHSSTLNPSADCIFSIGPSVSAAVTKCSHAGCNGWAILGGACQKHGAIGHGGEQLLQTAGESSKSPPNGQRPMVHAREPEGLLLAEERRQSQILALKDEMSKRNARESLIGQLQQEMSRRSAHGYDFRVGGHSGKAGGGEYKPDSVLSSLTPHSPPSKMQSSSMSSFSRAGMGAGSYYDGSSSGYDAKADSGSINSGGKGFPQQLKGLLDISRPHLLFSGKPGGFPDITRPRHLPGSRGSMGAGSYGYGGVIPQQSRANTDGRYGMAGLGYDGGGGYNSKASCGSSRAGGGRYHQQGGRDMGAGSYGHDDLAYHSSRGEGATAGKGGGSRSPEGSGGDYVMEAPTGISMPNRPFMQDTGLLGLHEAEVDEMAIRYAREEALLRSVRARALEDELARRRK